MPIKIPNDLPAVKTLRNENIFVMTETRAITQDIRPLKILLLNLMPKKIETETQLSRLLGNSPLQVDLKLIRTKTHIGKNTSTEHLFAFYETFYDIKDQTFDGLIITGAPVEHLDFEEVEYWEELCEIMEWSKTHVHSTFHICWGAQAGLYYHYNIEKKPLDKKLFGIFEHKVDYKKSILFRGFDDVFLAPHSRHTEVALEDVAKVKELKILATSKEAGLYAACTKEGRQVYIMGHSEYDADTLKTEYLRDLAEGKDIDIPKNYFPNDNPKKEPPLTWRAHASLLFSNWLNYFVYQTTPYDISEISSSKGEKKNL